MPGAHTALQERLARVVAGEAVAPPDDQPYYVRILALNNTGPWRETANYQALLIASEIHRTHLPGASPEHRIRAMALASKLYRLEEEQGMFRGEAACPDPHSGMHLEAHMAILLGALRYKRTQLYEISKAWWGRALRFYRDVASPDGEPYSAGLRCKTGIPRNQAGAALVRELWDLPHRTSGGTIIQGGLLLSPGKTKDPFYTQALYYFRLLEQEPKPRKAGLQAEYGQDLRDYLRGTIERSPHPRFTTPMHILTFNGGLCSWIEPENPNKSYLDPCSSIRVTWAKPGKHQVEVVKGWGREPYGIPDGKRIETEWRTT